MNPERRENPLPRIVVGLVILCAGVIFWLDRIGTINAGDYEAWWPLALIAMGLAQLPQRKWIAAAIWLVTGTYALLPVLGVPGIYLTRIIGLWPLLISAGGVTLAMQALGRAGRERSFRAVAVMGGNTARIGSQRFAGGEAVAVMGGCQIDLTHASIAGEAVIDVLAFWGGVEIRVPRGWKVIGKVAAILGGYEDKTASAPDNAPRLVIRGSAIMGGIEVKNPKENGG